MKEVYTMKKIYTGIIGCGAISPIHADAVRLLENAELLYVADIDPNRAKAAAEKYQCRYVADYSILLANPDIEVVHLCLPHYLHAPVAIEFLKAGKHVLTEKPMGMNVQQCEEMIRVSEKTGKTLGVCFQNRYHDTSTHVKELIDSGSMGQVLGARAFVTWERNKDYYTSSPWRGTWEKEGGSLLMNQAIHTLDLLQWFMGEVADVRGIARTHFLTDVIETEDTAEALILFESGARALFYATNAYVSNAPVYIEILCEKGTMILNGDLSIQWKNGCSDTVKDALPGGYKSYWGTGHKNLIHDFYRCIREGAPFPVDGYEGMKAIEIIEKIYGK